MISFKCVAKIKSESVEIHWISPKVDRPHTFSISCGKDRKLAARLARAVNAGAVFHDCTVEKDVSGATYVGATSRVLGRILNADLKRLGY